MRSPRCVTALVLLALTALAGPTWAAGSVGGSYAATVVPADPDFEPFTLYLVLLQNGNEVALALLEPELGEWTYGFGTLDAENRVAGTIIDPTENTEAGQFNFRLSEDGTVTGSINYFDTPGTLSGRKFF